MAPRPSQAKETFKAVRKANLHKIGAFLKTLTPEQLNTVKMIAEANAVERLDEESADAIPLSRTYFNVGCTLFLALLFAGIFVAGKDNDPKMQFDFLAYALPMLAGGIAGAGLFNRRITNRAFKWSVGLLIFGFVLYLFSKRYFFAVLCDTPGYFVGFGLLSFAVFRPVAKDEAPKNARSSNENKRRPADVMEIDAASRTKNLLPRKILLIAFAVLITGSWTAFLMTIGQSSACNTLMHHFDSDHLCVIEKRTPQSQEGSSEPQSPKKTPASVPESTHTKEQ